MRKFCNKCDKSVPMNHKCGTGSTPRKKTPSINGHRRFRKLRLDVIVRDNGECVRCRVLYDKATYETPKRPLYAHHIKPQWKYNGKNGYPDLRWEPTNLITLCHECHDIYDYGKVEELDFEYDVPPLHDNELTI